MFNKSIVQYLPSVAVGLGVALVAPILVVATVSLMRPLAKAAIKGGFIVKDAALGACSLAGSQVEINRPGRGRGQSRSPGKRQRVPNCGEVRP